MIWIVDAFSVLSAVAGWYYLFYSRAAQALEDVETRRINLRRVRLRRCGGGFMMLLGALVFAGSRELRPAVFIGVWTGVLFSLLAIVILALIDLRLTWKLRESRRQGPRT